MTERAMHWALVYLLLLFPVVLWATFVVRISIKEHDEEWREWHARTIDDPTEPSPKETS